MVRLPFFAEGDILDDLAVTYLLHLPSLEYTSHAQLFYAFEQAWWHYGDQHQKQNASLRGFKTLAQFAAAVVERTPSLHTLKPKLQARCCCLRCIRLLQHWTC